MPFKFILTLLCSVFLLSARPAGETITWSETRPLAWNDFGGKAIAGSPNAALSSVSILPHAEAVGSQLEFDVNTVFTPSLSWVRSDKKTGYLLKHEQGHFDIGELFARKMRKALSEKSFIQKTFVAEYKAITNRFNTEFLKYTADYDTETHHSLINEKQEEWDLKIAQGIKELEANKASHFSAVLKQH
ncbi:MAG: hypothetical protein ACHQRM_03740 [Bacteroidia bacterium]